MDGSPRDASPRSPARGTTPGSRTRDKKKNTGQTPRRKRAPLRGAGRKAFVGGSAPRSAPKFPRNFPVLLEHSGSIGTDGFHQIRKVLSELTCSGRTETNSVRVRGTRTASSPAGTPSPYLVRRTRYANAVQGPRPRRPGRRHRTSFDGLGSRTRYKDRVLAGRDAVTVLRTREDKVSVRGTVTAPGLGHGRCKRVPRQGERRHPMSA